MTLILAWHSIRDMIETVVGIGLSIAGIIATFIVTRRYYKKGSKETVEYINEKFSSIESALQALSRMVMDGKAEKIELVKLPDGKWELKFSRQIVEHINISDTISVVKNPDDPNRREVVQ
jgi:hypothetical protein